MRRTLALIASGALIAVAVVAVTLAFADSGSSGADRDRTSGTELARGDSSERGMGRGLRGLHGGPRAFGLARDFFRGLAERLDVTPERLREAVMRVKRRMHERRGRRGFDRPGGAGFRGHGRPGFRRPGPGARARIKARVLGGLAAELEKPVAEVTAAVRAELVEALDRAVAMGLLSGRGRELALGCFDRPRACDLGALRREAHP
jgi:hypothetical protein